MASSVDVARQALIERGFWTQEDSSIAERVDKIVQDSFRLTTEAGLDLCSVALFDKPVRTLTTLAQNLISHADVCQAHTRSHQVLLQGICHGILQDVWPNKTELLHFEQKVPRTENVGRPTVVQRIADDFPERSSSASIKCCRGRERNVGNTGRTAGTVGYYASSRGITTWGFVSAPTTENKGALVTYEQ